VQRLVQNLELPKDQKKQLGLPISQLTVSLANALSHSTVAKIPWEKKTASSTY